MEYILFSRDSLDPAAARRLFDRNRISYRQADTNRTLGRNRLVTNAPVAGGARFTSAFMGSAFTEGRYTDNFTPISQKRILDLARIISRSPASVTGTFTCLVHDRLRGETDIYLDDGNFSPCFHARDRGGFAVSNNIHMVADWLRARGTEPTRSIEPFLGDAAFGSGLIRGTLYREVDTIGAEQRLRAGPTLDVVEPHPPWANLLEAEYEDLVQLAADRIRRRMESLSNLADRTTLAIDFTGGMDSRVLIAALVSLDAQDAWHFNTLFDHPNPDGNFAEYLGNKLGMKRLRLTRSVGEFVNPYAQFRFDLFHSMGVENKRGFRPYELQPDVTRVHGSFGELGGKCQDTKRFFRYADGSESLEAVMANYLRAMQRLTGDAGMTPAFQDWARSALRTEVTGILDRGFTTSAMPAMFYRFGKARAHYGYLCHLRNLRTRYPAPLNDPCLTAAAIRVGAGKSLLGRVNLDLIRALGGKKLAAMPLVLSRWRRELFDSVEELREFSSPPITRSSERLFTEPCPVVEPPPLQVVPIHYRETMSRRDWPAVDRREPRRFLFNELRQVTEQVRRQSPGNDTIRSYLPTAVIDRLLDGDADATDTFLAANNVLKFFTAARAWSGELERPYYADEVTPDRCERA